VLLPKGTIYLGYLSPGQGSHKHYAEVSVLTRVYLLAIRLSRGYTVGMETKPTTMRLTEADKQAIERIKELYGCPSDIAAIRLAIRMVALLEIIPQPRSDKEWHSHPARL
jgi:hypothetical protein